VKCTHDGREPIIKLFTADHYHHITTPKCMYIPMASKWCAICRARSLPNRALKMYAGKSGVDCGDPISPNGITVKYNMIKRRRRLCYFSYIYIYIYIYIHIRRSYRKSWATIFCTV